MTKSNTILVSIAFATFIIIGMNAGLIGVAWPYANGRVHLGHIAGAYLPPDIFARYHRMAGNHVLMVSGSDVWLMAGLDAIVSNPPYIADGDYAELPPEVKADPQISLLAGQRGLRFL